jgi:hypothetical protein
LLTIKQGQWTLERIKKAADQLFAEAKQAYKDSKLPDAPQREQVNRLCVRIVLAAWENRQATQQAGG